MRIQYLYCMYKISILIELLILRVLLTCIKKAMPLAP